MLRRSNRAYAGYVAVRETGEYIRKTRVSVIEMETFFDLLVTVSLAGILMAVPLLAVVLLIDLVTSVGRKRASYPNVGRWIQLREPSAPTLLKSRHHKPNDLEGENP